jgi:hypothetical protein
MENTRNELKFIEVEKAKVGFLEFAKKIFSKEIEQKKCQKNESILLMYEQGRISREEYIMLISTSENVIINLNLDHSINANGGTWGGHIIMGDNHGNRF